MMFPKTILLIDWFLLCVLHVKIVSYQMLYPSSTYVSYYKTLPPRFIIWEVAMNSPVENRAGKRVKHMTVSSFTSQLKT